LLPSLSLPLQFSHYCIQSRHHQHHYCLDYCPVHHCIVKKGESINPHTTNTDTVEWHFADAKQMVGRSTNKLTAAAFDIADKKASTFNATKFSLLGNNANGVNAFSRQKRF
jgi:hypothetical protein